MQIILRQSILRLLELIQILILARVVISWLPVPKDNRYIRLLYQLTEPFLAPIRNMIERSSFGRNMMIDFSPIIVFLILSLLESMLR